jgi:hypothetical protein
VLFVVAGYPASGKTFALTLAGQRRATLFPDFALVRERWAERMKTLGDEISPVIRRKDWLIAGPDGPTLYRQFTGIWHEVASKACQSAALLRPDTIRGALPGREISPDGSRPESGFLSIAQSRTR